MAASDVRIGVVGAGKFAQAVHIPCLQRVEGCRVTMIADRRPELARAVAARFGIPHAGKEPADCAAAADVDGILVSVYRWSAGPATRDALKSGKAVFSEKPLAQTADRAAELVEAAQRSGSPLMVGFMK